MSTAGPRRLCEGGPRTIKIPEVVLFQWRLARLTFCVPVCLSTRAGTCLLRTCLRRACKSHRQVVRKPHQGGAECHPFHLLGAGVRLRGRPSASRPSTLSSGTYWAQNYSGSSSVGDIRSPGAGPPVLSRAASPGRACQRVAAPFLLSKALSISAGQATEWRRLQDLSSVSKRAVVEVVVTQAHTEGHGLVTLAALNLGQLGPVQQQRQLCAAQEPVLARRMQMRAVQESPRCGARPGCPAALGDLRAFDPMPRPLPGSGSPRPVGGHLCRK